MINFEVKNRFTGAVQFTAQIECHENAPRTIKLGFAVKWAIKSGTNLSGANLSGANLSGVDLSGVDLRIFKSCLWNTLLQNPNEVEGVATALREGRVSGSTYSGECACLVGTIANIKGVDVESLPHNSSDPSERWFMMISKGDKPTDETGGGFAAKMALQWVEEFIALRFPSGEKPLDAAAIGRIREAIEVGEWIESGCTE